MNTQRIASIILDGVLDDDEILAEDVDFVTGELLKFAPRPKDTYQGKSFDQLHHNGPRTWGVRWLSMNMALRDAFAALDLDFSKPENAMICTTLATAALEAIAKWHVKTDGGKIVFEIPADS